MGDADDTRARLRAAQLRATPPRIAVLEHLDRQSSPVTHPQVCTALALRGWNRGTLHRTLADLTRAGLVRKRDFGDHLWRYETVPTGTRPEESEHPHFLCTTCGAVACLPTVEVLVPQGKVPRVLATGTFQVQLRGICDRCLEEGRLV